ncbi:hypothetical protein [Rhizobium leguminosarum]|uniref:hypothetical protein n=1 Tax=Rhizobium leguminosarum TaxID=384 RepID=UPI0013EE4349|nr:hypothetical protein [Rhizobium leguminosarum]
MKTSHCFSSLREEIRGLILYGENFRSAESDSLPLDVAVLDLGASSEKHRPS